jgi:hypothetical protein
MLKRFVLCLLTWLSLLAVSVVWGDQNMDTPHNGCLVQFPQGYVNWTTGKVYASGKVVPADRKKADSPDFILSAARSAARRNLIETLKLLDIYTGRSVGTLAASNHDILAGIEKNIMDAKLIKQSYTSNRTIEVVLETAILGGFLQLVLPEEIKSIPTLQIIGPPASHKKNQLEYTGLIIDATAIGFDPVLYPVVVSELGAEIYNALFISREFAVQRGVCRYLCSMDSAETAKWVGDNPIRVKGLRKGGSGNSSIVISRSDADRIEKIRERHRFMKECRVIILVAQ